MLYYLIGGLGVAALVIALVIFAKIRNHENVLLKQIVEKRKKEIDAEVAVFIEKRDQVKHECDIYENMRQQQQLRALDAKDAAERLIKAEHERAATELQGVRALEEEKLKHDIEARGIVLENQFNWKKQQFQEDFNVMLEAYQDEIAEVQAKFDEFQAKRAAVNEAILREKELQDKESFYSIDIPKNDQEDIQVLQSMDMRLHNRDVIPKLIWELFIRRPCQEMIKRVTGGRKIGGIYKITYKKTGEAYVGKTTDFATRWANHCKTAIGLEGAARATLHNRLGKDGLWNYTWEILEIVDKDHLSSREAFYIDLYGTKTQLNMKDGDKNGTK